MIESLLNLKDLAIRMHSREEAVVRIRKRCPGTVTATDIQLDHDVEIVNPDYVLAHLAAEGELNMELIITRGRGYEVVESEGGGEESRAVGLLKLDASYSPVRRVSYSVENARVEQRTDLDKLIIEIVASTNDIYIHPNNILYSYLTLKLILIFRSARLGYNDMRIRKRNNKR